MLAPGSWTVTARGLIHFENVPGIADGDYEGAVSEPKTFNVGFAGSNTVSISIQGGIQTGVKGLFSYAVSFPDDVTGGELRFLDLAEQPVTGLDPVDLLLPVNRSGTIALDPGYYLLQVELENSDGNYAYKTEVLHIYSNLTTTADGSNGYAFTAEHFAPMSDVSGQVALSTSTFDQGTLYLYRDNGCTQLIESVTLSATGSWSAKISSYYTSVYLKAEIDYTGYPQLTLTKGPIALTSTNPADWTINAGLLDLAGTVQLDTVASIESNTTPALSLYSDSAYTDLIETVDIDTSTGAWNITLLPEYDNVYLKATVDYDGFDEFDWTKGPVAATSTTAADWEIDARLPRITGTVPLVLTDDVPGLPDMTVKVYSDADHTTAIQNGGSDLSASVTANSEQTSGSFEMILPVLVTNPTLYFKVDCSASAGFTNPGDYTITGGTGSWAGILSPGTNALTLSALYIAGYCSLTTTAINDSYGDQTAYGSAAMTAYDYINSGKYKGSVTVTATANSGYVFVKWVAANDRTAPALSANAVYTFTIQSDTSLYAVFNTNGTPSAPIEVWEAGTLSNGAYLTDTTDAATSGTLNGMRNGLDKSYKLVKNITLTGTWTATGDFTGLLDGNGKTITFATGSSLAVVGTYAGIFGEISIGSVKDLTVAGTINITGTRLTGGGAIVGFLNQGRIQRCAVTGSINASSVPDYLEPGVGNYGGLGGIVGYTSSGTIEASYVTGEVRAHGGSDNQWIAVGGIAGYSQYGTVKHCYTTGYVAGGRSGFYSVSVDAGGIVGLNNRGTVEYCYAFGSVQGGTSISRGIAGGIVGMNASTVRYCVALNSNVSSGGGPGTHRVVGNNSGTLSDNYGRIWLLNIVDAGDLAGVEGASVDINATKAQTWWFNSGGVFNSYNGTDVSQPWAWNAVDQRPSLYWEN
jgi:hypothetical protein